MHNNSWGSALINNGYSGTSVVMDQAMWDASTAAGLQPMPSWRDGLRDMLAELGELA